MSIDQSETQRWTLHLTGSRWKETRGGGGYLGGGDWVVDPEFYDSVEESVEVMPVAEHEAIVATVREVRTAFDAGDWPIGPSYKAVQDALRTLDSLLDASVPPHDLRPS